jgi:hypothetical protein
VFGFFILLSGLLLIGFLARFFFTTVKHNSGLTKKNKAEYSQTNFKKQGQFRTLFLQIGFAPLLALGMTYVFWQGWSTFVNFVVS